MGEALALLSLVLFSTNVLLVGAISSRLGQEIGFLLALGTNVLFSGVLALGFHLVTAQRFAVEWDAFAMFAIGGLFTSYLGRRLFFLSVQSMGPSRASALQITNPVFAGIISWVFLGESLGVWAIVFIAAVLGGLYLTTRVRVQPVRVLVAPGDGPEQPTGGADAPATAKFVSLPRREITWALVGALSYAIGNVVRSSGVRDWNEPIFGGFLGAVAGTIAYLLLHTELRTLVGRVRESDRLGVWLWGLSGVLTISAQISLIAATRHIPIAIGVVISAALPVLVIPASVILFHNKEAVTARTFAGSLLVLAGVAGLLLVA